MAGIISMVGIISVAVQCLRRAPEVGFLPSMNQEIAITLNTMIHVTFQKNISARVVN